MTYQHNAWAGRLPHFLASRLKPRQWVTGLCLARDDRSGPDSGAMRILPVNVSYGTEGRLGFLLLSALLTLGAAAAPRAAPPDGGAWVEVFTTTHHAGTGQKTVGLDASLDVMTDLQLYELDGIQRITAELSEGLPANRDDAQRLVLHRLQGLDDPTQARLKRAATGLARALQYGIDRYPAVVFNGKGVVYGVSDLQVALNHYRTWRSGGNP